jgi:hypothetical protein
MVAWHLTAPSPNEGEGYLYALNNGELRRETTWYPARIEALEMSPTGAPWVAVTRTSRPPFTDVYAWSGTGFSRVGVSLVQDAGTTGYIYAMDLDFDAEGRTYIAWRHDERIYLQRWDGTRWALLGSRDAPGQLTRDEELALKVTPEGNAYIAWTYRPATEEAALRLDYWDGSTLQPLITGLPSDPFGGVALALDAAGRPVVAWVAPPPVGSHQPTLQVRANH